MTEAPTCQTCFHYALVDGWHHHCKRHHKMIGGKVETMRKGWTCSFERDDHAEPRREDGDKCGPDGIHWRSRL